MIFFLLLSTVVIYSFYNYINSNKISFISFYSNNIRNDIITNNLRSLNEAFQFNCKNLDIYKLYFDINGNKNEFSCGQVQSDLFNFNYKEKIYFDINKSNLITELNYTIKIDSIIKKIIFIILSMCLLNYIFFLFIKRIYNLKEKQALEYQKIKTQSNLSKKLAHDIRSPLSTLNLITTKIEHKEAKELQLAVIEQINKIAENLLIEVKKKITKTYQETLELLQEEYKIKKKYSVCFRYKKMAVLKNTAPDFLYSTLNNLIQNGIEATSFDSGRVEIDIATDGHFLIFIISDNGKGIPEHILIKLGETEITYGKGARGNGFAIYSAKKEIESYGGYISIESLVNKGTTVTFKLPI